MPPIISVSNLSKTYGSGFKALNNINLEINCGEIFALLGPNGAGKTTLISIICGIANLSEGRVTVGGYDINRQYRAARSLIGLVPQELHTDAFESVWATVSFSRGLFGKPKNPAHIEKVLKDLSLWDKKDAKIVTLSGGMKRRVMIAKALSHEPQILFLDEPTAGVDVELRKGMWEVVRTLQAAGVTIILTTHYIEEAERLCDRVAIVDEGRIIALDTPSRLQQQSRNASSIVVTCATPFPKPRPAWVQATESVLDSSGHTLTVHSRRPAATLVDLVKWIDQQGLELTDVRLKQPSLEDVFIEMTGKTLRQ